MPAEYIPDTTVILCKGVPLDSTYTDTIKFTSQGAQTGFFQGKAAFTFDKVSYQRVSYGISGSPRTAYTIRVDGVADQYYGCNYMMFRNTFYGPKWFYAFIKTIDYVSPETTRIWYEIDHFQTWLFDFEVMPCMVLREHTKTDNLFEHLAPEPFGQSDMIVAKVNEVEMQTGHYINVGVSTDTSEKTVAGQMYNNIYSGVELHEFSDAGSATAFIREYDTKAKAEGIVCVFMSPFPTDGVSSGPVNLSLPSDLAGYVPRNKKLLSYPYIKLQVSNRQGEMKDYYYEYFSTFNGSAPPTPQAPHFVKAGVGGITPSAFLYAAQYKGGNFTDYTEMMEVTNFPRCAWTSNAFANWWGGEGMASAVKSLVNLSVDAVGAGFKNARHTLADLIGSGNISIGNANRPFGISMQAGAKGALAQGAAGVGDMQQDFVTGAIHAAADLGAEAWVRSRCPGLLKGAAHGTSQVFSAGRVGFDIYEMSITPEAAAIIDDFFDQYGYAINRVKVPEMEGREAWNYVQTQNCIIKGSMPVDSMDVIKGCFNRGIRLWHNGDWTGDYSHSNYPT